MTLLPDNYVVHRVRVICYATQHGFFDNWWKPPSGPCCFGPCACACAHTCSLWYPRNTLDNTCACAYMCQFTLHAYTHPTHVTQALSQYQCVCNAAVSARSCSASLFISSTKTECAVSRDHTDSLCCPRTNPCSPLECNASFVSIDQPKHDQEECLAAFHRHMMMQIFWPLSSSDQHRCLFAVD